MYRFNILALLATCFLISACSSHQEIENAYSVIDTGPPINLESDF